MPRFWRPEQWIWNDSRRLLLNADLRWNNCVARPTTSSVIAFNLPNIHIDTWTPNSALHFSNCKKNAALNNNFSICKKKGREQNLPFSNCCLALFATKNKGWQCQHFNFYPHVKAFVLGKYFWPPVKVFYPLNLKH